MNRKQTFAAVAILSGGLLNGEEAVRFDHKVRQDFFAGIAGDKVALARGMKTTEEFLIKNPDHAEALEYCSQLQNFLLMNLWEEAVLITARAVYHHELS